MSQVVDGEGLDVEIATRIATLKEVDQSDLPPLYEIIDLEAVETVLDSDATVNIEFTYVDCHVVIDSERTITITSSPNSP